MKIPVSALVHTLNEEKNIKNCLECVSWADDIVVIDMHSEDKTVEIAKQYTDNVFLHERLQYADPARQFGLNQAKHEWVLVVDADELVPVKLRDRLLDIMRSEEYDAVSIPHCNYFFGHAMIGAGWGALQDKHVRFYRKQFMTYGTKVHGFAQLNSAARVYEIKEEDCAFIHFNYIDPEQFVEKLNRYTTIEAENAWDAHEPLNRARVVRRIIREITKRFIKKKGYKDGFQGFLLACLMAGYQASAALKRLLIEKYQTKDVREKILQEYSLIAQQEIEKYKIDDGIKAD
ncbi:MAG: glycosyl transferase [Firmicutes bacterium]|nr:glycosyl transferase [Bacillota bacterium]